MFVHSTVSLLTFVVRWRVDSLGSLVPRVHSWPPQLHLCLKFDEEHLTEPVKEKTLRNRGNSPSKECFKLVLNNITLRCTGCLNQGETNIPGKAVFCFKTKIFKI